MLKLLTDIIRVYALRQTLDKRVIYTFRVRNNRNLYRQSAMLQSKHYHNVYVYI